MKFTFIYLFLSIFNFATATETLTLNCSFEGSKTSFTNDHFGDFEFVTYTRVFNIKIEEEASKHIFDIETRGENFIIELPTIAETTFVTTNEVKIYNESSVATFSTSKTLSEYTSLGNGGFTNLLKTEIINIAFDIQSNTNQNYHLVSGIVFLEKIILGDKEIALKNMSESLGQIKEYDFDKELNLSFKGNGLFTVYLDKDKNEFEEFDLIISCENI